MTEVNYNGKEELLMADYEGISDSDLSSKYANTDFDITDAPSTYITNAQMTYALTCKRLFPAGDTYICNDEGTYKKGHTYQIKVSGETKSWEDVTPTPTVDDTPTATSNNPVKSSGIYTALQGKQDKLTAGENITIDENNVISASGGSVNLYSHNIKLNFLKGFGTSYGSIDMFVNIISSKSDKYTSSTLREYLYNSHYVDASNSGLGIILFPANCVSPSNNNGINIVNGLYADKSFVLLKATNIIYDSQTMQLSTNDYSMYLNSLTIDRISKIL